MAPRFFVQRVGHPLVDQAWRAGDVIALAPGPTRHVQVLRLQPGDALTVFDGRGGEWHANVAQMGRSAVSVQLVAHAAVERELGLPVTLAVGMPANERMDALVEKATELGVAVIQPLLCERAVLRLAGERADKKVAHWQAVAIAACEQSGRTRVPTVLPVRLLLQWLPESGHALSADADPPRRWLLSLGDHLPALPSHAALETPVVCLSGPEGGLSDTEEQAAIEAGFTPVSLGPRVLRADTAPLAVLAHLGLSQPGLRSGRHSETAG